MLILLWLVALIGVSIALAYVNASGYVWTLVLAALLGGAWAVHLLPGWIEAALMVIVAIGAAPLLITGVRRRLPRDCGGLRW